MRDIEMISPGLYPEQGVLVVADDLPVTGKERPRTGGFAKETERFLDLGSVFAEAVEATGAVRLQIQDQIAADELPTPLMAQANRILRMPRGLDHLPAAETDAVAHPVVAAKIADPLLLKGRTQMV